ncbi:hypothetical protein [Tenacibaculum insulae]|uniref:hypothetical protein n=1 Tax=Tenacibaculum insulae TaxID=2029677 RepID=UPI003AB258DF
MKRLILTLIIIIITNLGYAQSIAGESVSNWDECVSLSQTEFKYTCLGDDREKGWLSAHTTITNNCDQRIRVTVKYQGSFKNGESTITKSEIIKPNSSVKIYECHAIANQGSWEIISVQSTDRNYTSPATNSSTSETESYNNQETNYNNNSSYQNTQTESIYEKRRREAQEAEYRREQAENKRRNEAKRFLDNEKKSYERYNASMDKIGKEAKNLISSVFEESNRERERKREKQLREWEEEERLEAIKRKQRREKYRREEEERLKKERIETAKTQFMNTLTDAKIPLSYSSAKAYFILLAKINDEEIKLSKLTLHKNSDNQLPYKQDVLNKFKKKHNVKDVFVYGVYSSQQQQESYFQSIKRNAQSSYINIGNDITFSYNKSGTIKTKTSNTDFWGNKKKKTTTTKKKSNDFWN